MAKKVIGIDPSSRVIAFTATRTFHREEVPTTLLVRLPEGMYHATGAAFREVFCFLMDFGRQDSVVYMEEPVMARRNPHATIVQSQVGGAIMAAANEAEVPLYLVNNKTWKKRYCGNGNSDKTRIMETVRDKWPEAFAQANGNQDIIDSAAINRCGVERQMLVHKLTRRSDGKAED